jgi:hypothetical protein
MVLAFVLFLVTGVGFPVVALGGWHGGFKTGIVGRLASRIGPRRTVALLLALGGSSLILGVAVVMLDRPPPRPQRPLPRVLADPGTTESAVPTCSAHPVSSE